MGLTSTVAFHDGAHHILGHLVVIGQQLLGVLRQTVASVAETRVVVVRADARVQTYSFDDGTGVQSLHLGVGVQFVEVAHP